MIRFHFNVMGEPTTAETARTPEVANNVRAMEADLRKKLKGAVPESENLDVLISWNQASKVDFRLDGSRAAVEAAGRALGLKR
jgi:hypothetical protein